MGDVRERNVPGCRRNVRKNGRTFGAREARKGSFRHLELASFDRGASPRRGKEREPLVDAFDPREGFLLPRSSWKASSHDGWKWNTPRRHVLVHARDSIFVPCFSFLPAPRSCFFYQGESGTIRTCTPRSRVSWTTDAGGRARNSLAFTIPVHRRDFEEASLSRVRKDVSRDSADRKDRNVSVEALHPNLNESNRQVSVTRRLFWRGARGISIEVRKDLPCSKRRSRTSAMFERRCAW